MQFLAPIPAQMELTDYPHERGSTEGTQMAQQRAVRPRRQLEPQNPVGFVFENPTPGLPLAFPFALPPQINMQDGDEDEGMVLDGDDDDDWLNENEDG